MINVVIRLTIAGLGDAVACETTMGRFQRDCVRFRRPFNAENIALSAHNDTAAAAAAAQHHQRCQGSLQIGQAAREKHSRTRPHLRQPLLYR